jgi:hypothetical protein
MKKILLTFALLAGVTLAGYAQKTDGGKFSIGIDAGVIVGEISDRANLAIGGSVKYDKPIFNKTSFNLSAGYSYLPYTNDYKINLAGYENSQSGGEGYIPLKAGLKYMFNNAFYGEGQLGAAIATSGGGGTAFLYAPGVGMKFGQGVDFGVRYEAWATTNVVSQFALRLAYSF